MQFDKIDLTYVRIIIAYNLNLTPYLLFERVSHMYLVTIGNHMHLKVLCDGSRMRTTIHYIHV